MKHTLAAVRKSRILMGLAVLAVLGLTAGTAFAALCVWRNPSADIQEFFGGGSYRTLVVNVGNQKAAIEREIGTSLDPDENVLQFWPVTRNGQRVGTVSTHLGRGDYGAIEVVIAIVDPPGERAKVHQVKIQRDRERHRQQLRSAEFLNQFRGKQANSPLTVGQDIRPAHPNAVRGSEVVALSVKKMLVAYEKLNIANR